ncbi:type 1 glutamine amidotransferase [Corynebacterium sp. YSMAA1_1_D6]|uniref:type 1 glutamine amidotransferase n=1 Tax=Corynebacterium sp. YSMAA1_1_D6 TaxID=3383589 RepID=UPI0038CFE6C1
MITVIQPDPIVGLDRFENWLDDEYEIVPPTPSLEDCGDRIIVLGGRMNAIDGDWLEELRQLLIEAVSQGVPVLGICLGHQILATAFGGDVSLNSGVEDGPFKIELTEEGLGDPMFSGINGEFVAAESHYDSVTKIPEDAVLLASSEKAIQAFRIGSAIGVQFHPEASPKTMAFWATLSDQSEEEMLTKMSAVDDRIVAVGQSIAKNFGDL